MTAIEERAIEIGKMFGMVERTELEQQEEKARKLMEIRERRRERHKALRTALKLKIAGSGLNFISEITELPEDKLVRFFHRVGA